MRRIKFTAIALVASSMLACNHNEQQSGKTNEMVKDSNKVVTAIFPKGEKGASELFTGNAYHYGFQLDSTYTTVAGNVYFEPGARTNWHLHPAGQILIITDGVGYHQIEGQPIEIIKKGDIVQCPPNVNHWHGASAETGLQQIYIVPNTEKGIVEWKEAVTDEEYFIVN